VAIVWVHRQDFVQTNENFFLNAVLGVNERCEFFCEINRFVDCDLSSLLLVFLKQSSKGLYHDCTVADFLGLYVEHLIVL